MAEIATDDANAALTYFGKRREGGNGEAALSRERQQARIADTLALLALTSQS